MQDKFQQSVRVKPLSILSLLGWIWLSCRKQKFRALKSRNIYQSSSHTHGADEGRCLPAWAFLVTRPQKQPGSLTPTRVSNQVLEKQHIPQSLQYFLPLLGVVRVRWKSYGEDWDVATIVDSVLDLRMLLKIYIPITNWSSFTSHTRKTLNHNQVYHTNLSVKETNKQTNLTNSTNSSQSL